jgi:Zn-dependent protease
LPIGGVASIERMPKKPSQELAVAVAGPAVNIIIAIVLLITIGAIEPRDVTKLDDPHVSLLAACLCQCFLVLFNMVPAFPMDGGRVLRAIFALRLGLVEATRIAALIDQRLPLFLSSLVYLAIRYSFL